MEYMENIILVISVAALLMSIIHCLSDWKDNLVYRKQLKQERKLIDNIIEEHKYMEEMLDSTFEDCQKSELQAGNGVKWDEESRKIVRDLYKATLLALYNYLSGLYNEKAEFTISIKILFGTNEVSPTNANLRNLVATYCSVPNYEEGLQVSKIEQVKTSSEYQFLYDGGKEFVVTDLNGYRKKAPYMNSNKAFLEEYQTSIAIPLKCPPNEKSRLGCDSNDLIGILCICAGKSLKDIRKNEMILDACRYTAQVLSLSVARYYNIILWDILQREMIFNNGVISHSFRLNSEGKEDMENGKVVEKDGSETVIGGRSVKKTNPLAGEEQRKKIEPQQKVQFGRRAKAKAPVKGTVRKYSIKRLEDGGRIVTPLPNSPAAGGIAGIAGREKDRRESSEQETEFISYIFCASCGQRIPKDSVYCSCCGARNKSYVATGQSYTQLQDISQVSCQGPSNKDKPDE